MKARHRLPQWCGGNQWPWGSGAHRSRTDPAAPAPQRCRHRGSPSDALSFIESDGTYQGYDAVAVDPWSLSESDLRLANRMIARMGPGIRPPSWAARTGSSPRSGGCLCRPVLPARLPLCLGKPWASCKQDLRTKAPPPPEGNLRMGRKVPIRLSVWNVFFSWAGLVKAILTLVSLFMPHRGCDTRLGDCSFEPHQPPPRPSRWTCTAKEGAGRLASDGYPAGINVLAPHFHAAAGAPSRPLPRHP